MENTFRRYRELTGKAKKALQSKYGTRNDHLESAVGELSYLRDEDIPDSRGSSFNEILDGCRTTKPKGEEGLFRAAIDAMTLDQRLELEKRILML